MTCGAPGNAPPRPDSSPRSAGRWNRRVARGNLTPGHPARLQASVLNHRLRQLASLHYVIWRTPSVPGSVTLDYLQD